MPIYELSVTHIMADGKGEVETTTQEGSLMQSHSRFSPSLPSTKYYLLNTLAKNSFYITPNLKVALVYVQNHIGHCTILLQILNLLALVLPPSCHTEVRGLCALCFKKIRLRFLLVTMVVQVQSTNSSCVEITGKSRCDNRQCEN